MDNKIRAFWATSPRDLQLQRLGWYASDVAPKVSRFAYILHAGPVSTVGVATSWAPITVGQRWCPYEFEVGVLFHDPGPYELREFLVDVLRPAHVRGSWYRRERVEPFANLCMSFDSVCAPPLPKIPSRCTQPTGERRVLDRQLNEAIAYLRGHR